MKILRLVLNDHLTFFYTCQTIKLKHYLSKTPFFLKLSGFQVTFVYVYIDFL